ncbi:diguanylate cyclase [Kerstersia gyiorum]|nr:diguanylate cyclase [Kerstersia gyiorum]
MKQGFEMLRKNTSPEEWVADWRRICGRYGEDIWVLVQGIVREHKAFLATRFYEQMMQDAAASFFLSAQLVQNRLHPALQAWLEGVFSVALNGDYEGTVAYQKRVGGVHARIGIPTHLVMRGTRALNEAIFARLQDVDVVQRTNAVAYVAELTSLAMEVMCQSYAVSHDRNSRAEEAYRLFAISQDIGAEREKQRAALLGWENQFMYEVAVNQARANLPLLGKSEFGLWFTHKAAHAFEGSADVASILAEIDRVDAAASQLGSMAGSSEGKDAGQVEVLRRIRDHCRTVGFLLEGLFQQAGYLESGRDVLTRLLNRKYLQVIMNREIEFARTNGCGLAVLMVDIDHFKRINDEYGHDGGDAALRHVGLFMSQTVRSSDYLFRLGGEEFLVVLVDVEPETAMLVAENLRRRAENERIPLGQDIHLNMTLSIGVALYAGHPDYLLLLKAADQALYRAKHLGRNRVELSRGLE